MKPASFAYHAPHTLDEALRLVAELEDARLLAGGQSLVPMLNLRLAMPAHVIDLGRIASLAGIEETDQRVVIGAMTTQRQIEKSPLIARRCPLLHEAIAQVGHQQTRNRGTIGGSLCHLDPAAELPVVAAALEATLEATSIEGTRRIAFRDFPVGYLQSQLRRDEILTRVEFPALEARTGWAFVEFARREGDFAITSVAALVTCDADGKIARARIAAGGLGPRPMRVVDTEERLAGRAWSATLADVAGELVAAQPAEGDALYPADYRRHLAGVLARRALAQAVARARNPAHA